MVLCTAVFCTCCSKQLPDIPHYVEGSRRVSHQVKGAQHVARPLRDVGGGAAGVILPQIQAKQFGMVSGVPSGFTSVLPSHKSTSHGHFLPHVIQDTRAPSKVNGIYIHHTPLFAYYTH